MNKSKNNFFTVSGLNHTEAILVGALRIKGCPIPASAWPTIAQAKESFIAILTQAPERVRLVPMKI
jgi:hypothetical protein